MGTQLFDGLINGCYKSQGNWSSVQTDVTLLANNSQHCRILNVEYVWTPCCILMGLYLRKVWNRSNFWTNDSQHFFSAIGSPKRGATMMDPFAQLSQHCWGHARTFHMVYKNYGLYSSHDALQVPTCICLHTSANTDETTPNIVCPLMLRVVFWLFWLPSI